MEKFYFTFGSWEKYPFPNRYLVVEAESKMAGIAEYRKKYPDVNEGCVNCAAIYTETQWNERVSKHYNGEPAEVLRTKVAERYMQVVILLENAMSVALDEVHEMDLLGGMGCTKEDLKELGVNVDEVFR